MNDEQYTIEYLDVEKLIPREKDFKETGGAIYLVLGATGSGKTNIIKSLLISKSFFIPVTIACSASEDMNGNYSKIIPDLFVYNDYTKEIWTKLKTRQLIAKDQLDNPLIQVVYDDIMTKTKNMGDQKEFFTNSRQYMITGYIASQGVFDLDPQLRDQIAGVFIMRTNNETQRSKIYKNFASEIPNEKLFNSIMDSITTDYGALFIDKKDTSDNWINKVKWFKAFDKEILKQNISVVSKDVLAFHDERYNKTYNSKESLLKNLKNL